MAATIKIYGDSKTVGEIAEKLRENFRIKKMRAAVWKRKNFMIIYIE